jgi:hypothetical protein
MPSPSSSQSSFSSEGEPEVNQMEAYNRHALEHWDEQEFDFDFVPEGRPEDLVWSDGDMPLTDGEDDLRFLIDGELEAESDSNDPPFRGKFTSCTKEEDEEDEDEDVSSDTKQEQEEDTSSDEPPPKRIRGWAWSDEDNDDEEEEAFAEGYSSSDEEIVDSSDDGSYPGDSEDDNSP